MLEDLHKIQFVEGEDEYMNSTAASMIDLVFFWGFNAAILAGVFFGGRKIVRKVRGVK